MAKQGKISKKMKKTFDNKGKI
jgi:hypothetical protein